MSATYPTKQQPSRVPCDEPHLLVSVDTRQPDEAAEPPFATASEREVDWQLSGQLPEGLEPVAFSSIAGRREGRQRHQALRFVIDPSSVSLAGR